MNVPPCPCPNCGETVAEGANIHTCDECGKDCCTACTSDVEAGQGLPDSIVCDECHTIPQPL